MPDLKKPKIPSYRLHKPSGRAVVRLNGRDFYLGPHGSPESQAEYERLISEWLANHRQLPEQRPVAGNLMTNGVTVNELLVAFWDFAQEYYVKNGRPTGEQQALKYAMAPLAELYGRTAVAEFSPRSLKAVRERMIEQDLARSLINARVRRIRHIFKWGVEHDLVPPSVLHGLQAVAPLKRGRCRVRETEPVQPVPEEIVDAVLPHVLPPVAAMIRLQVLTGMRPGEVVIMRGCDLDRSERVWVYIPASHKTEHHGRPRVIYLGPQAQTVLKPWLKPDPQAYLFSPAEAEATRDAERRRSRRTPMTPSQSKRKRKRRPKREPKERYTVESYCRAIHRGCDIAFPPPPELRRSRVKCTTGTRWETPTEWANRLGETRWARLRAWQREHRWSPGRLRHNAATHLRKQFGIEAARVVLGHSSAAVTEVYAELDLAKAADIMAKVG